MTFLTAPPRTAKEIWQSLPEGTLCQLIHNQLFMSPAPSYLHQKGLRAIVFEWLKFLELQSSAIELIFAPIDVHLTPETIVQPDILLILPENQHNIQSDGLHGTPDIIVEILSPGNKSLDIKTKKALYFKHQVKEYFIVDPEKGNVISYYLSNNYYKSVNQSVIKSEILGIDIHF
ncbi:MAG: Uma2 family endonuclease [Chitinophagales bacterium]|nr:Uma2 family endonuclease [Chitinophagales bacterium]